jgi:RES domain-containing protein
LVHLELDEGTYPDPRKLLEVSVPEDCLVVSLDLPEAGIWVDDLELTRRLGTDWLRSLASPLAIVPSVIVSEARNYLLNPVHPDAARITIISERWQTFDRRLFRLAHH